MIHIQFHCDAAGKVTHKVTLEGLAEELQHAGGLLWLDVATPTESDLAYLNQTFRFHPLAMANLTKPHE